jgi:LysR family transcriptional regulator, glycine cleavage system transcriptional activator
MLKPSCRMAMQIADAGRDMQLGDIGMCLAAAAEGGGVALGRSLLVSDAIADGRLAPLFPEGPVMRSSNAHVARWPAALSGDADVHTFVTWLADEATQTCAVARLTDVVNQR